MACTVQWFSQSKKVRVCKIHTDGETEGFVSVPMASMGRYIVHLRGPHVIHPVGVIPAGIPYMGRSSIADCFTIRLVETPSGSFPVRPSVELGTFPEKYLIPAGCSSLERQLITEAHWGDARAGARLVLEALSLHCLVVALIHVQTPCTNCRSGAQFEISKRTDNVLPLATIYPIAFQTFHDAGVFIHDNNKNVARFTVDIHDADVISMTLNFSKCAICVFVVTQCIDRDWSALRYVTRLSIRAPIFTHLACRVIQIAHATVQLCLTVVWSCFYKVSNPNRK